MSAATRRTANTSPSESARWWTIGGPFALVVAMLLLGAALRTHALGLDAVTPAAERTRGPIDLVTRSTSDAQRLTAEPDGWTLQFLVACEDATLQRFVEQLEQEPDVFLLAHSGVGANCYRVCWGRFRTKQDAQRPRTYPDVLRDVDGAPWATPISNVLP